MPAVPVAELLALQRRPDQVRNICILAHVDHGKTSLTDSLISSNGIISQRQAGRLRYLDSRDDEQDRGITMKSSAIALVYDPKSRSAGVSTADGPADRQLINLVDSPGHVDFGAEVSTAVQLADGAVVVVDAVEGVCVQTHTVLQQVWREQLSPVLFINKLDRLIVELQLKPEDAFRHLRRIVAQVNAVFGALNSSAHYRRAWDAGGDADADAGSGGSEDEVADFEFRPEEGNVVFGSALYGWAFIPSQFASLMAPKLGVAEKDLEAKMWGDWYFSPKAKGFTDDPAGGKLKPLFVQLALANLWRAHDAATDTSAEGADRLANVIATLRLRLCNQDLRVADTTARARAVLSAWLPLAPTLLDAVMAHVPAAPDAQRIRVPKLLPEPVPQAPGPNHLAEKGTAVDGTAGAVDRSVVAQARSAVAECDSSADLVVAHVSKMFVNARGEEAVGFARVYSGTLRKGQALHVSGVRAHAAGSIGAARESTGQGMGQASRAAVDAGALVIPEGLVQPLLMMGRDLIPIDEAPSGNLCAIAGIGGYVVKGATLSSKPGLPPLRAAAEVGDSGAPIVRVAVEAVQPSQMAALEHGLRRLNQADPSVEVERLATGELVLGTCGEVHLERCLRDLRTDFAPVEFTCSAPLIPFRETAAPEATGAAVAETADHRVQVCVTVRPLRPDIVAFLARSSGLSANSAGDYRAEEREEAVGVDEEPAEALAEAVRALVGHPTRGDQDPSEFPSNKAASKDIAASPACVPAAVGPAVHPTCVLFLTEELAAALEQPRGGTRGRLAGEVGGEGAQGVGDDDVDGQDRAQNEAWAPVRASAQGPAAVAAAQPVSALLPAILSGFQLAASAGPLCEEPMADLAVSVDAVELLDGANAVGANGDGEDGNAASGRGSVPPGAPVAGQLITAMRDAVRTALLHARPRLVEAIYTCEVQASQEVLGRMHGVLSKRRARVTREDLVEGTPLFVVRSELPVVESIGFAGEIRKMTSGAAHPQLRFSHWKLLDLDPLETLSTIDDDEFDRDTSKNLAREYMNAVRRRKGLLVEEKLVQDGTKQRTIARK